jgi:hypothetical protein
MRRLTCHVFPLLLAGCWLSSAGGGAVVGDVHEVSMVKLNNIEYQVGDDLPKWVTALDGETIRISGFMRNGTLEGEAWFDLTNDSCGCGTSKLQHFVRVTLGEGTTTFTPDELVLEGTFSVGEKLDEDEFVESIFRLKVESL